MFDNKFIDYDSIKTLARLMMLISFGTVGAVFFTPGLPEMAIYFNISNETSELTITSYLIGYTIGLLIYGPMSNVIGSKKTVIFGASLTILSAILCIFFGFLHSFNGVVFSRVLMAIGACSGLKMTFHLSAHLYSDTQISRAMTRIMMAFAIIPALGIFLSGILINYFGWISSFYIMIAYSIAILILNQKLPEIYNLQQKKSIQISHIMADYWIQLKNLDILLSGFLIGTCSAFFYSFATIAPFIGIKMMKLSPSIYGFYNFIPLSGIIAGSLFSTKYLTWKSSIQLLKIGIAFILVGTLILFATLTLFSSNPLSLFLPAMIVYIGVSFIYGNAAGLALKTTLDKSNGSSTITFINASFACVSVLALGQINIKNAVFLPTVYLCLSVFSIWLYCLISIRTHNNNLV